MSNNKKRGGLILAGRTREPQPPTLSCPRCHRILKVSLLPFERDISQIGKDKCPYCGGDIYMCVLLLGNTSLPALSKTIESIVSLLSRRNKSQSN